MPLLSQHTRPGLALGLRTWEPAGVFHQRRPVLEGLQEGQDLRLVPPDRLPQVLWWRLWWCDPHTLWTMQREGHSQGLDGLNDVPCGHGACSTARATQSAA